MDYQLPSYQQATGVQDWLDLVAPYVDIHDYRNLCLVNKRFFTIFAPFVFRSPLDMAGQLNGAGDPDRGEFRLHHSHTTTSIRFSTVTQIGPLANNSNQSVFGIESL